MPNTVECASQSESDPPTCKTIWNRRFLWNWLPVESGWVDRTLVSDHSRYSLPAGARHFNLSTIELGDAPRARTWQLDVICQTKKLYREGAEDSNPLSRRAHCSLSRNSFSRCATRVSPIEVSPEFLVRFFSKASEQSAVKGSSGVSDCSQARSWAWHAIVLSLGSHSIIWTG